MLVGDETDCINISYKTIHTDYEKMSINLFLALLGLIYLVFLSVYNSFGGFMSGTGVPFESWF